MADWFEGKLLEDNIDNEVANSDISEGIINRRNDLYVGIKSALKTIPVDIIPEKNAVKIIFQEILICGVEILEEVYRIYNVSAEWKEKTFYLCNKAEDGSWFYYLETIDECIGEVKRVVMYEAQKDNKAKQNNEFQRALNEIDRTIDHDKKYQLVIKLMQEQGIDFAVSSPSHVRDRYRILDDGSSIFILKNGYKMNMCNEDKMLTENKVGLQFEPLYKNKREKLRDPVRPWTTSFANTETLGKVILCLAKK